MQLQYCLLHALGQLSSISLLYTLGYDEIGPERERERRKSQNNASFLGETLPMEIRSSKDPLIQYPIQPLQLQHIGC